MKKALLATYDYPPNIGGVANYYYNLVQNLPKDKLTVVTNEASQFNFKLPCFSWLKSFFTLKKIIHQKKIEVLLVGQILPLGTTALLLKKIFKIPYLVFTHAMDVTFPQKYPRKKWLMKIILKNADKIITVSRYTKYEILKLINQQLQKKIEIITPAPNITPQFFPNNDYSNLKHKFQDYKIILSVGRLVPRKGHDVVIKSLNNLIKNNIKFKYIIIGDGGNYDHLKNLVQNYKLENFVIFIKNLSDEEVAKYYQLCDVFIMPCRETENRDVEGFGIVFLEANSFKKPIIGGKSGGVEDAIIDGKNGYLVDPLDTDMISNALMKILLKPDLAKKLGEFGQQRVISEFNWEKKAKQLELLLL